MPDVIREELRYSFDDDEARARLEALAAYWSKKHGVHTEWSGTRGRLVGRKLGVKYDASFELGGGTVSVEATFGFLADKLGGPDYVRRKLADYLDPKHTLESLRARVPK
ncbi:MAG: polyhydroxyalkanoic acid system family protein [Myxococcales bacterium]|nr:polyhydroxyalkanoic acid system family protein [Myxococcales bacterium]